MTFVAGYARPVLRYRIAQHAVWSNYLVDLDKARIHDIPKHTWPKDFDSTVCVLWDDAKARLSSYTIRHNSYLPMQLLEATVPALKIGRLNKQTNKCNVRWIEISKISCKLDVARRLSDLISRDRFDEWKSIHSSDDGFFRPVFHHAGGQASIHGVRAPAPIRASCLAGARDHLPHAMRLEVASRLEVPDKQGRLKR